MKSSGHGGRKSDKVVLQNEIVKEIGRRWRAISPEELWSPPDMPMVPSVPSPKANSGVPL